MNSESSKKKRREDLDSGQEGRSCSRVHQAGKRPAPRGSTARVRCQELVGSVAAAVGGGGGGAIGWGTCQATLM